MFDGLGVREEAPVESGDGKEDDRLHVAELPPKLLFVKRDLLRFNLLHFFCRQMLQLFVLLNPTNPVARSSVPLLVRTYT